MSCSSSLRCWKLEAQGRAVWVEHVAALCHPEELGNLYGDAAQHLYRLLGYSGKSYVIEIKKEKKKKRQNQLIPPRWMPDELCWSRAM